MTSPDWLKPGIYGGICGAVLAAIVGFSWGGWVTGGSAEKMAAARSTAAVTEALVPVCLDMSMRDPGRTEKLATIQAASTFKRGDAVMDAGWATVPGTEAPNRDLARACLPALELEGT